MWRSTLHPAPVGLRLLLAAALLGGAGALLAGCNETGMPTPVTAASAPVADLRLPPGTPCAGEIGRFQAVVKDDLDTGNVERKVYEQIQGDLGRAAAACSAGKGGEANAIVAATKARHGYRAGSPPGCPTPRAKGAMPDALCPVPARAHKAWPLRPPLSASSAR